ncbi:hypothetical protein, partial [Escherichia coli]|uniref:hypothetical protein n=1 Tax=Escherichia coli TaxID=562 RepID=UPI000681320E
TSIFSHPVYLFLRKFSLQDSRGGSDIILTRTPHITEFSSDSITAQIKKNGINIQTGRMVSQKHLIITHDQEGKHLTTWYQQISLRVHSYKKHTEEVR